MALKIEKTFEVPEPLEKVWAFLSDPRKVATCVPGAQITDQVDEKTYRLRLGDQWFQIRSK